VMPGFGSGAALAGTALNAGAIKLAHKTGTRIDLVSLTPCSF